VVRRALGRRPLGLEGRGALMPLLAEPRLEGVDPGTPRFFAIQRELITERPLLRAIYELWYAKLLGDESTVPSRSSAGATRGDVLLELGSGGSFLKDVCPRVLTSDVEEGIAERVIDGRELPFDDESVRAIFLTHVFHHIPDAGRFLAEAQRVLVPGGVIAMIEVAHTPFARFFFSHFHPEPYDDRVREWAFAQDDAMMDANQALSWIVFERDRDLIRSRFPKLSIERCEWLPWCSYLLSGGVTRKSVVPRPLTGAVRALDGLLSPIDRWMALHWHLTVRKLA